MAGFCSGLELRRAREVGQAGAARVCSNKSQSRFAVRALAERAEGEEKNEQEGSPFADPNVLRGKSPPKEANSISRPEGTQTVAAAKQQLRRILPYVINLNTQRSKIEYLIKYIEFQDLRPLTESFAELGLNGRWQLLYTTTTLGTPSTSLRVRRVEQHFDIEQKKIHNCAWWSYLDGDCHGKMTIVVKYKFVGTGRISLEVEDYLLKPDGKLPEDPQALAENLYRALPREFWDPNGSLLDLTYMDPDFRIVRYMGKKYAGVRNILERVNPDNVSEE